MCIYVRVCVCACGYIYIYAYIVYTVCINIKLIYVYLCGGGPVGCHGGHRLGAAGRVVGYVSDEPVELVEEALQVRDRLVAGVEQRMNHQCLQDIDVCMYMYMYMYLCIRVYLNIYIERDARGARPICFRHRATSGPQVPEVVRITHIFICIQIQI